MARTLYMVTVGDYRSMTPVEVGRFPTAEEAELALGRYALAGNDVSFPQLFEVQADYDGEFLDSRRLSPDWAQIELEASGVPERFKLAPRAKGHGGFIHTCNGDRMSGLPFGRRAPEHCARCWELVNGAAPREDHAAGRRGRNVHVPVTDAERAEHRRTCRACRTGDVCTAFDW